MNKRIYLIDGFGEIEKAYVNALMENSDGKNDDVIVLSDKTGFLEKCPLEMKVFNITDSSKVSALYHAKILIDRTMTTDITLISSTENANFWCTVCKELLTAVYNLKFETPDSIQPSYDIQFIPEIQNFLSSFKTKEDVSFLKSPLIDEVFIHGFSTRKGGLSTASGVSSLNITPAVIKRDTEMIGNENVRRLGIKAGFNPDKFVKAKAVHGNTVYVIGNEEPTSGYDCIVSDQRNVTVAAPGADCITMVFADPITLSFGACHSGWKGTLLKACIETVKKMQEEFGSKIENIKVAFGPCIRTCCLEFGPKEAELFKSINEKCVIQKPGKEKPFIDLCLANRTHLEKFGILPCNIDDNSATLCTSCNHDLFYSYRRDKIPFGNQVGFIGIK